MSSRTSWRVNGSMVQALKAFGLMSSGGRPSDLRISAIAAELSPSRVVIARTKARLSSTVCSAATVTLFKLLNVTWWFTFLSVIPVLVVS